MRSRLALAGLLVAALIPVAVAQSVSSVQPRSIRPGETSELIILGKDFHESLRATASLDAEVRIESVEADNAVVQVELPADSSLGPMGVWIATNAGTTDPIVLMVDDLPATSEIADNHSPEHAQEIASRSSVTGASDGANSDYFRFRAEQGQRIAFEVLTQSLASKMDPVVRLINAEGETLFLSDDDDLGPEPRFSFRFQQAGEYLIEVRDSRYASGDMYHLRVGDFPCVGHCFPLAIQKGNSVSVEIDTTDESVALPANVSVPDAFLGKSQSVAARLADGESSAWTPIHVSSSPQIIESDQQQPIISFPVGINGRLAEVDEQDEYAIRGITGANVRFASYTRSLKSRALLQMHLFKADGTKVAETKVSDADEWSFDYTFPDDGEYRLRVSDLLGRGGPGFGYLIEVAASGTFSLSLKGDAKTREQFLIEEGQGACAVDLQVVRFGYDGEIDLSLDDLQSGVRILNPRIGAKVNEATIYLLADSDWKPDAAKAIRIVATAIASPEQRVIASSLALHRAKQPHVPFPDEWSNGVVLLSGTAAKDAYCAIETVAPIQFARPLQTHTAMLNLKRIDEKFKAAPVLLSGALPEEWTFAAKAENDSYTTTWTRTDAASEPASLPLLVYSEFNGMGRVAPAAVPVQWIDPIQIRLESSGNFVAGRTNSLLAICDRTGPDPQGVEVRFTKLPDGWTGPDTITIAADVTQVAFDVSVPSTSGSPSGTIEFEAVSQYQGAEFQLVGQQATLPILPLPTELVVHPSQVTLVGKKSRRQLVVTGYDATGSPRDWTRDVAITVADPAIADLDSSVVQGRANGETQVMVQIGPLQQIIPVHVRDMEAERKTQFESEVLVALSKQGCNSGACHGSPSGKGMFRLSLRAFDRELDELTLMREDFGRRVNRIEPEQSLLLLKPLMKVSHGGGKKLHGDEIAYAILRDWIAEGATPDAPETPRCVRLEVFPQEKRILALKAGAQQISVLAHFEDGSTRDVTHLAAYESSNTTVATVNEHGLIASVGRGESAILVRYLEHIESIPIMFIDKDPDFQWAAPATRNYIDELVNAKLLQLQFLPSDTCSDAEFLRRVHLDVIGILPTVEECKAFLADTDSEKRSRLIDQLLERDEYAKFWALKWGDLLKMTGKLVGDEGVYKYHRWVEESFQTNMPYDEFARALLSAEGSTLANPPANFYRTSTDMNDCVETVSQVFLGARLQCAKCHNHPFERWTQDNYYGLGAFFHRVQRRNTQRSGEMFIWTASSGEVVHPRTGKQMAPWLPNAGELDSAAMGDRREALVDWLVQPDNPYFAKMEVNRIWSHCFARGIVDPIDDFRDSNPPSNGPLLDALAKDFAEHGFDRKHLLRTILNSQTYQASYEANESNREDELYFSHQRPRMLSAEQLLDAVNHVTSLKQTFGHLPANTKATHLPAPDVVKVEFLKVFGQPERSTVCACERTSNSNLGMAIELFNGEAIHQKLRDANNRFRAALAAGKPVEEVLSDLYLAAVCRPPSADELEAAMEHCKQRESVTDGVEDVCWALLNTDEFLFQH